MQPLGAGFVTSCCDSGWAWTLFPSEWCQELTWRTSLPIHFASFITHPVSDLISACTQRPSIAEYGKPKIQSRFLNVFDYGAALHWHCFRRKRPWRNKSSLQ
jgi:hypothetical protein